MVAGSVVCGDVRGGLGDMIVPFAGVGGASVTAVTAALSSLCKPTRGDITLNPYPFFSRALPFCGSGHTLSLTLFPFDLTLWPG